MPSVFDSSSQAIGSIQASLLTEAQFQAQFGTGWVLARGQSVSGSKYASLTGATSVPDMRGMFLRGKNNGRNDGYQDPEGERNQLNQPLPQTDAFQSHNHKVYMTASGGISAITRDVPNPGDSDVWSTAFTRNDTATDVYAAEELANGGNGTPRVGSETRVKNIVVNYFIRIN